MLEQALTFTIGMADTVMVSGLGESAISAVSLVDQLNMLLLQVFGSLATGGAVVAAQYIGRQDRAGGCDAARQLLQTTLVIGIAVMAAILFSIRPVLSMLYGSLEPALMDYAVTYLTITTISLPFFAIYSAGASLFRAMGNSKVSLYTSMLMNAINIGGNALTIYGFGWGVEGAALATTLSRAAGAAVFLRLITKPHQALFVERILHVRVNPANVRRILRIGVPNGVENGVFQVGKLVVMRLVSSLGTASIAANAVCSSLSGLAVMPGIAAGMAMITVVGQCAGAGAFSQARRNTAKLLGFAIAAMAVICGGMMLARGLLVGAFNLTDPSRALALPLITVYLAHTWLTWPPSFALPNALRGAGDARFTMVVSVGSMMAFRVASSYLLVRGFNMGVMGVWIAMYIDWLVRSAFFIWRFRGVAWLKQRVL
ncbi:MAG: MATE family efflux transporter [Oscillospiraceae bacterium]|nr:MATE family efflux transporter [Oscillospiraceae bacterium]